MKECSKCHFQNTADSVFCANCGAKLVPAKKNSHATHHYWLWALAIILIALIIFEIGGHSTNSSRSHHPLSAQQFNAKTADRKMQTAAILYYAGENNIRHWPSTSEYEGNKKVTISKASKDYQQGTKPTEINVTNKNPSNVLLGGGGTTFFAKDGDNVYFYYQGGPITTVDKVDQKRPIMTVSWSAINSYIKDRHAFSKVQKIAQEIQK